VDRVQRGERREQELQRLGPREALVRLGAQVVVEVRAVQQLHCDVCGVVEAAGAEHAYEVRMADLGGGLGLLDHAGAQLARRHLWFEDFYRDVDCELVVAGTIHVGHAAAAEVGEDRVTPVDDAADEVDLVRAGGLQVVDVDELEGGALAGAGHRGFAGEARHRASAA
jgi:hypothetical protein